MFVKQFIKKYAYLQNNDTKLPSLKKIKKSSTQTLAPLKSSALLFPMAPNTHRAQLPPLTTTHCHRAPPCNLRTPSMAVEHIQYLVTGAHARWAMDPMLLPTNARTIFDSKCPGRRASTSVCNPRDGAGRPFARPSTSCLPSRCRSTSARRSCTRRAA